MAIVYEGEIGTVDTSETGSITVPAGGVAQGSTILIAIQNNGDVADVALTSVTDDRGNSYTADLTQDSGGDHACIRIVRALVSTALQSGDSITITFAGFTWFSATAFEFSGITETNPLDKTAGAFVSFDTAHSSGSTTATAQADELLFGAHALQAGNTWTAGSGFTEIEDAAGTNSGQLVAQYQIVSATGTYASSGTSPDACDSVNGIATYKATGGTDATVDADTDDAVATATASIVAPPKPRPSHPFAEINVRL